MAADPELLSDLNAAAATCQAAYNAFLASLPAFDTAHAALRRAEINAAPGVSLSRAGTGEPATNAAIAALSARRPFDFAAAVALGWGA